MPDRFEDLRTFVTVAETGGFAAAAERLGIARSAVSRRVRELEDRLGARLIHRTTRRLSLTEPGRALLERGRRVLADLEEAEAMAVLGQAEPRGDLRVAAPMSFGVRHLAPAIAAFVCAHPRLRVDLDLNDRLHDLVGEGFDVALRIGHLADSSLIARRIAPVRRVAVASPAYLAAEGEPEHPRDLARHRGLAYANVDAAAYWRLGSAPGEAGDAVAVEAPCVLRSNNGDVLLEAAVAGAGVAVLPTFFVHRAVERGELRVILAAFEPPPVALSVVYPSARHLSAKVRAFVDFAATRFGPRPYWDAAVPEDDRAPDGS